MTNDFEFTEHATKRLRLRTEIRVEWIQDALVNPDSVEAKFPDEHHYLKEIVEFGWRVLRVIVNPLADPKKIVTFHFDRGL